MYITEKGNHYSIQFRYAPYLVKAVKELNGRRFDPVNKSWLVPKESELEVREFAQRYKFKWGGEHIDDERIGELPAMPELDTEIPLKLNLFPYQATGVAYALQKKRLIIGDQPGLEKQHRQ